MSAFLNRRQFVRTVAGCAMASGGLSAQSPRRPNVLYVFSDQHRACSLPGEAHTDVEAPNMQRLATEGMKFRNCISNYPVCSPYRGILMSGRWPYQSGIIDNALALKEPETSLGEAFKRAGYQTGYIGKWHLDARGTEGHRLKPEGEARHGFDEWNAWYNTNTHFDKSHTFDPMTGRRLQPKGYNATLMTDAALKFIDRHREEPWMLVVSWNPPHPAFRDAPPELMKRYEPGSLQMRPNSVEVVERAIGGRRNRPVRPELQGYNAHITAIDIELGRLLRRLQETGQAENTILIYTSDHGEMMGAHNRMGKRLPHEESCKVPFFVWYPGVVPGGKSADVLLSAIDIYPTLCGLGGFEPPSHCQGRDLSAVARGETIHEPEHAFLMHIEKDHASGGRNHPAPVFRGVRTKRHTYAVGEIGRWCLYDHQEDPYQLHNLADDSKYANLMSDLDGEVVDYLRKAEDRYPFHTVRAKRSITSGRRVV